MTGGVASKILREQTTPLVLLLLCGALSVATLAEQHPAGANGGRQLARQLLAQPQRPEYVLIVVRDTPEDAAFAAAADQALRAGGVAGVTIARGQPADARQAIEQSINAGRAPQAIGATHVTSRWGVFDGLNQRPVLSRTRVVAPASYWWPNFLKTGNLLNVVNQVADIAIVAIGMTMVIIAGGIDLSVGSLIGLAAILMTMLIRDVCGGVEASATAVVLCAAAAVSATAAIGGGTGLLVTRVRIPPFIVTLGVMSIASGAAFILSRGETIDQVPRTIGWLGRGADLWGLPNTIVLMLMLYAAADLVMKRTTFGRYLYAVGGNRRAAWLSGLPVERVVLASYMISAALAALAGVMQVSLFHSGKPTFGRGYELQVIAAVVVGGTSLSGGEGKMLGTLLGALIIAVVQNGMNLLGIGGEWQPVVLGLVILAAAVIDRLKRYEPV